MKKIFLIFLSVLAAVFACGCGTYNPASPGGPQGGITPPGNTPGNTGEQTPFTVTLEYEGEKYIPEIEMSARWTAVDGSNVSREAKFDKDGVASIEGLDGDYVVTLNAIPDGMAYNPNIYEATNLKKDVKIQLVNALSTAGKGTDLYSEALRFSQAGVYCVTFNEPGQVYYCRFSSSAKGRYVIESIADITANEINPRFDYFGENPSWAPQSPYLELNDGSPYAAAYTKNFKYTWDASANASVILFRLKCDSRVSYPVQLYLEFYREGESRVNYDDYILVEPQQIYDKDGNFVKSPEGNGKFVYFGLEDAPQGILDGKRVALSEEDGYYHLKDADGNLTDTILYAKIASPSKVFNFQNPVESLKIRNVRLKDEDGNYIRYDDGQFVVAHYDYMFFIRGYNGIVTYVGSTEDSKLPEYLRGYKKYKDKKSYYEFANSDGCCAVTQELKDFLQSYHTGRMFFYDGDGDAEALGYNSTTENMWLCFCGYYA